MTTETKTKSGFAKALGVSAGRVSQLIAAGLPVGQDGRIDVHRAQAWVTQYVDREGGGWHLRRALNAQHNGKASADWDRARTMLAVLRCRRLKIELDTAEGKVLDADAVRAMTADVLRVVSERALSIPDKLAPAIAAATDRGQVYKILKDGITAELLHIAEVLEER